MLDKKTMCDVLKSMNDLVGFELNVALTHGAAMVMCGLKTHTNDIDVVILDERTRAWVIENVPYKETAMGKLYELKEMDFGYPEEVWSYGNLSPVSECDVVSIEDIKTISMKRIVAEKTVLGRPKDIAAIKLIEESGLL